MLSCHVIGYYKLNLAAVRANLKENKNLYQLEKKNTKEPGRVVSSRTEGSFAKLCATRCALERHQSAWCKASTTNRL